jgi:hypothetical protein
MRVFTPSPYGGSADDRRTCHRFVSLADHHARTYGVGMGRVVMLVAGALLALFVLFNFIIPLLGTLLQVALIVGVVGVIVFIVVTVIGKSSSDR